MLKRISVTADDIAIGVQGDYRQCPVANAIWRTVKECESVWVGHATGHYDTPGRVYRFTMPPQASYFINQFDTDRNVQPFTFDLEVEDEWIERG